MVVEDIYIRGRIWSKDSSSCLEIPDSDRMRSRSQQSYQISSPRLGMNVVEIELSDLTDQAAHLIRSIWWIIAGLGRGSKSHDRTFKFSDRW